MLREELLAGYHHPYRRFLPLAWRAWKVNGVLARGGAVLAAILIPTLALATEPGPILWFVGAVTALFSVALAGLVGTQAAIAVREHTGTWRRKDRSALALVRENRPHRGEMDREVVHSEYAVEVGDDGYLRTWCFTPLRAYDPDNRVALTGTPRYAAEEVAMRAFDALDVTRAAEALSEEQEKAAAWEAEAAEEGRAGLRAAETARELEVETRSTAAALRGATGAPGRDERQLRR